MKEVIVGMHETLYTCMLEDNIDRDLFLDISHPNYREINNSGGSYRGQVRPGDELYEGHGIFSSAECSSKGQWRGGRLHGKGSQTWMGSRSYHGQFCDGACSGTGCMVWKRPKGTMVYEGQYLNDMKHGHGKFTWPIGKAYEGQWVDGQRHGEGADIHPGGSVSKGLWKENIYVGPIS